MIHAPRPRMSRFPRVARAQRELSCSSIIRKLSEALREEKVSASEIVRMYLQRIEAKDSLLHSFVNIDVAGSLEQAKKVDLRLKAGEELSVLAGIPVAIKDNICCTGISTTAGSSHLRAHNSAFDAEVVSALRACGCVILGKTNMDEFGMGSTTETSFRESTRNPWDFARVPGGSSGGSAAAVAGKLCVCALGSDTGGSIRQPAAFCGVVGLKPTYGSVSRHGLIAYCSSFDTIGPIGPTVEDVCYMFEAIQGRKSSSKHDMSLRGCTVNRPQFPDKSAISSTPLKGRRFAVIAEAIEQGISIEVNNAFLQSISRIELLGGIVDLVACKTFKLGLPAYYVIALSEASSNLARYDGFQLGDDGLCGATYDSFANIRQSSLGEEVRRRILMGTYTLSSGYNDEFYERAKSAQRSVSDELASYLSTYDAFLTPATSDVAYKLGEKITNPLQMYAGDMMTVNVNLAGLPAIVVPIGAHLSSEGTLLPIGLQLIGKHFGEFELMELAHLLENCLEIGGNPFTTPPNYEDDLVSFL